MSWLSRALNGGRRAPRDVDSAMRSALLAVLSHDFEEAERLLSAAISLDSSNVEAYVALARVYRARGEVGRAIRLHQNLLLRSDLSGEQLVDALVDLAGDLRAGGFTQRAIASFEEALGHDARRSDALRALLDLYRMTGESEKALAVSRRLARIDPSGATERESGLRIDLAEASLAEGHTDAARRALKEALRADKNSVRGWLVLGNAEAERGKPKAALAAWARVPGIDRARGPEVYPRLAATYAALEKARDFEGYLRGLIEADPDDPHARLALARALAARGDAGDAISVLRDLLSLQPHDLEARATLAQVLISTGRTGELDSALTGLIEALEHRGVLRESEKLG
jgi:lipopolysaccharide biosynthesis regulator YciM